MKPSRSVLLCLVAVAVLAGCGSATQPRRRSAGSMAGLDRFPVVGARSVMNNFGAARPGGRAHQGNDVMAKVGRPVVAVEPGTVVAAGTKPVSGKRIWLVADDGVAYFYCHLRTIDVRAGDRVWAGARMGRVGTTGNAVAKWPHLHFEIHPRGRYGRAVDPHDALRRARHRVGVEARPRGFR